MKHRQRGLTLVELMVTLAAAIILLAVGMPLFSGIVANNRAVAQANDLVSAFKLARSEAVKRTRQVTVCAIDDPTAAVPACGAAADWSNGWTVFLDDGGSIDEHLRVWIPSGAAPTIVASVASVVFTPRGERLTTNPASLALTSTGSTTTRSHCLVVPASGQVRMRTFRPTDGEACP
jgi:type IV fimbrial biogenesis protein FimT